MSWSYFDLKKKKKIIANWRSSNMTKIITLEIDNFATKKNH